MSRLRILRNAIGLTLVELVVVSGIFTTLSGIIYSTMVTQTRVFRRETAQSVTQNRMRIWMDRMMRDIRRIGYDPKQTGLFGIVTFTSNELRFTSDANGNGVVDSGAAENLGYKFESGTLSQWTGSSWRPLMTGIGGLTFTYRDVKGKIVSSVKEQVSFVEIALSAEVSTAAAQGVALAPSGSPVLVIGDARTTVQPPSGSSQPVLAQIERTAVRNPR